MQITKEISGPVKESHFHLLHPIISQTSSPSYSNPIYKLSTQYCTPVDVTVATNNRESTMVTCVIVLVLTSSESVTVTVSTAAAASVLCPYRQPRHLSTNTDKRQNTYPVVGVNVKSGVPNTVMALFSFIGTLESTGAGAAVAEHAQADDKRPGSAAQPFANAVDVLTTGGEVNVVQKALAASLCPSMACRQSSWLHVSRAA